MDAQPHVLPSCPACDLAKTLFLEGPSTDAHVYYFRCPRCGHVWTTDRDNAGFIRHVTPLTKPLNRREA